MTWHKLRLRAVNNGRIVIDGRTVNGERWKRGGAVRNRGRSSHLVSDGGCSDWTIGCENLGSMIIGTEANVISQGNTVGSHNGGAQSLYLCG